MQILFLDVLQLFSLPLQTYTEVTLVYSLVFKHNICFYLPLYIYAFSLKCLLPLFLSLSTISEKFSLSIQDGLVTS